MFNSYYNTSLKFQGYLYSYMRSQLLHYNVYGQFQDEMVHPKKADIFNGSIEFKESALCYLSKSNIMEGEEGRVMSTRKY